MLLITSPTAGFHEPIAAGGSGQGVWGAAFASALCHVEARRLSQGNLIGVEGEENGRAHGQRHGHMKKVHAPDRQGRAVLLGELAGAAHGIGPTKLPVRPVAQTHFHFQATNQPLGIARRQASLSFQLVEAVKNFHPLPRRPEHAGVGIAGEEAHGGGVVSVVADHKVHPPRGVRVVDHRPSLAQGAEQGHAVNLAAIRPAQRALFGQGNGHLTARLRSGSRTRFGAGFRHELFRSGFRWFHGATSLRLRLVGSKGGKGAGNRRDLLVFLPPAWQNQSVSTSTKEDPQATAADDASRYPKPYRDPSVTCDVVHDCYQHVWGGYLALARHFEAAGDAEQAAIYHEKYWSTIRFELDLWKLSDDEMWRHHEEVLPPLIQELHALEKQHLGD